MGVNTPAAAVAIVGLTHPGPVPTPYSVAEYKNMVGRAGRLGFTERGKSYLVPSDALTPDRGWTAYVNGRLEDLRSQLVPDGDPRTLMLRVLASYPPDATGVVTEETVLGFCETSFAAFQAREGGQAQSNSDHLTRSFEQLVSANLIAADGDGFVSLSWAASPASPVYTSTRSFVWFTDSEAASTSSTLLVSSRLPSSPTN
jgi:helicase